MQSNPYLINLLLIMICILLLTIVLYLFKSIQNLKKQVNLREYEINVSSTIDDNTFGLLDKLISECFAEYIALNVEYKDITYIDANLEKEISKAVSYNVSERLSPTLITKISLVYNINNLSDLITKKVYLHVINYSIEKNRPK